MNTHPDVYLFGQVLGTHSFLLKGGFLPAPVERMLESKHGLFDKGYYDYRYDGVAGDAAALCEQLRRIDNNTDED